MATPLTRLTRACVPALLLLLTGLSSPAQAQPAADAELALGAYLAKAGDCAACHTADKARPFAGGLPLATPFGTLYSTNITPDAATGIATYRYDDFANALRKGIAKDGHRLYPAMPYPSYSKIDDGDMHALYRYFMQGVKAASRANEPNALKFPFNLRPLMTVWDRLYANDATPYRPDPQQSAAWNRGAYLVQGLGHCGACHTPHGMLGQEAASDDKGNTVFLAGYALGGWYAPGFRDRASNAAAPEELVRFLRSGRLHDGAAFGPMTEVVDNSTQFLSDADLGAIATYLTSPRVRGVDADAKPTPVVADSTAASLRVGKVDSNGAMLYLNNCSACHRSDGNGAVPAFPALNGNAAVTSIDATSLIRIVLSGSHMPSTNAAPTPLAMPDFGWRLADQQVAELLTFVRGSWSNRAAAVRADDVAKVRTFTRNAGAN